MAKDEASAQAAIGGLQEVKYSLRDIMEEVKAERESSTIGQEIVDQTEISKLFNRKKKVRRGKSGE
jgi:phosphate uptake regulator